MKTVIFVCGLPGVGKSSLARFLGSEMPNSHCLSADLLKQKIYPTLPGYEMIVTNSILPPDNFRMALYEEIVRELSGLVERYDTIIVDENLFTKKTRQWLFAEVDKIFQRRFVIWVTADDSVVQERLSKERDGHTLKDPLKTYNNIKGLYEPLTEPDFEVTNNHAILVLKTIAKLLVKEMQ